VGNRSSDCNGLVEVSKATLFEFALVVALPELRRRPDLTEIGVAADAFETLHFAEDFQTLRDVLGGQDLFQLHAF
jgi:hypothetical protein